MSTTKDSALRKHLIGQAGEWFVVSELLRGGYWAQERHARWPGHDLLVQSPGRRRECRVEVKAVSSHASTYATSIKRKDFDVLVLVSHLRAESAHKAKAMGRFGSASVPRFFVVPRAHLKFVIKNARLGLRKAEQEQFENRWDHLGIKPVPRRRISPSLIRASAQYFVAAHLSRSGYPCILTTEIGNPVPRVQLHVDHANQTGTEGLYLTWAQRQTWGAGGYVSVDVAVRTWRDNITIRSTCDAEDDESPWVDPSMHAGLIAFVDMRDPFKRLAVFPRELLRKCRKSRSEWHMEDLRDLAATKQFAWAV